MAKAVPAVVRRACSGRVAVVRRACSVRVAIVRRACSVRVAVGLLTFLLLTSTAPAAAVTGADAPETGTTALADAPNVDSAAARTASGPTIRVDTTLSLTPDDPGAVGVVQTFSLPSEVTGLQVTLHSSATVTRSSGFAREGERWVWDGETSDPTLRYRKPANQTAESSGPMGASGSYLFVDTGPWALVRTPNIGLQWRYRGSQSISVSRTTQTAGEGAVGGTTAFLGAHEEYTRTANGQTFRLVVPDAAEMASSPQRVLQGLANASGAMQVGSRDPEVFAVAAPASGDRWAVQGLQVGSHDFWVRDSQSVTRVGNAWLHEYVHTRQSFTTADSARWFTEASATWYAALLSLEEGATFADLQRFLSRGENSPQANAVLADPGSWQGNANYWKGALVLGEVDRRVRLATNQSASLQTAFRSLNSRTEPIENTEVLVAVGDASSASTRQAAERFTTTTATPETWTSSAHREAFGTRPAQMRVTFDAATDVRYAGPFRTGATEQPVVLAAGERLVVDATVQNVGDATGSYEVVLRVNDEAVTTRTGTLGPGENASLELYHRFGETGSHTVSVAGDRFEVRVREPATLTVTELRVDRSTARVNGTVTATATVENADSVPGNRTVAFTRDGETVARRTVTLGPGESTTVSATVALPEKGEVQIGAGERAVSVQVREAGMGPGGVSVPGFGIPAAVVAVAVLSGLFRLFSAE